MHPARRSSQSIWAARARRPTICRTPLDVHLSFFFFWYDATQLERRDDLFGEIFCRTHDFFGKEPDVDENPCRRAPEVVMFLLRVMI